jgi:hypothetical protein
MKGYFTVHDEAGYEQWLADNAPQPAAPAAAAPATEAATAAAPTAGS